MAHFFSFSNDHWNPKRMLFRKSEGLSEGQRRILARTEKGVDQEQLRWELEDLNRDVTRTQIQDSLGRLEQNISQQEFLRQDEQHVTALAQQVEGNTLEDEETREVFFGNVEQRLTVLLVMLIRSRQLNYREFTQGNQQTVLDGLRSRKDQLRIDVQGGTPRALLPQEKSILDLIARLPNHALPKVKENWGILLTELKNNVQAVDFAADIVAATGRGETPQPPQNLTPQERGIWDEVKDQWNKVPDGVKKAALITAAVGGGIYLLSKLFSSNSGSSSFARFLGIGALIAGGVYIAGKYMTFGSAVDRIREGITGLTDSQVADGLRAFVAGDFAGARRHWGEQYETLRARMLGERTHQPATREVGGERVNFLPVDEAIGNYWEGLKSGVLPITSFINQHPTFFLAAGAYIGIRNRELLTSALTKGVGSMLEFARMIGFGAINHPFRSLLIVSAFLVAAKEAGEVRLPANLDELKAYLRGRSNQLVDFMALHGLGRQIFDDSHFDLIAGLLKGTTPFSQITDNLQDFGNRFAAGVADRLRVTPLEMIRTKNTRGYEYFRDQLRIKKSNEGAQANPALDALIAGIERQLGQLQPPMGILDAQKIQELTRLAAAAKIRIEVRNDNYIYWGEVNDQNQFKDPNQVYCLGINPGVDEATQNQAAEHFVSNPNSLGAIMMTAVFERGGEQLRELSAEVLDNLRTGSKIVITNETGLYLMDAATHRLFFVPEALKNQLQSFMQTGEFSAKELAFQWGDGLVPVMVLGAARSLMSFRMPFRGGYALPIVETALYPVTGTLDLMRFTNTRIITPFRAGGLEEVRRLNSERLVENFARSTGRLRSIVAGWTGNEMKEIMAGQDALRDALNQLRGAEGFVEGKIGRLTGGRLLAGKRIEAAQQILRGAGLDDVARTLNTTSAKNSIEAVQNALRYFDELAEGMGAISALRGGNTMSRAQLEVLRRLANNDLLSGQFRSFLGKFGVAADKIDDLRQALKTGTNLENFAQAFRRAGIVTEQTGEARALIEGLEAGLGAGRGGAGGASGARGPTGGGPESGAGRAAGRAAEEISEWRTVVSETLEHIRSGRAVEPRQLAYLREFANTPETLPALRDVLKSLDIAESELDPLIDLLKSEQTAEQISQAIARVAGRTARAAAEAAELARSTPYLTEALDAIRAQRAISLEQLGALRQAAGQQDEFARLLRAASVPENQLAEVARLFREERDLARLAEGLEATRVIPGNGIRGILRMAHFVPHAALGLGAAASAFDAYQSFAIAEEFRSNPEVRGLFRARGTAAAIAGIADLSVNIGLWGAEAASYGRFAFAGATLPLLVITAGIEAVKYMVTGALDARAEVAMNANDYVELARRQGPEELIHRWVSTGDNIGAGEAYDSFFTFSTVEGYQQERIKTRIKLIEALILSDTPPNRSQDFNAYRMKYIESVTTTATIPDFQMARKVLAKSKVFAYVMENRQQTLSLPGGHGIETRSFNLTERRYNPDQITVSDVQGITTAAMRQNSDALMELFGVRENAAKARALSRRVNSLDINYINHAISVMLAYKRSRLNAPGYPTAEDSKWDNLASILIPFVQFSESALVLEQGIENPAAELPNLSRVFFQENLSPQELQVNIGSFYPQSKGVAALYHLGKYFGYSGRPDDSQLKQFFNESHASMYGVYWDGRQWMTNDKNGNDESHGMAIDEAMPKIIAELESDPSDVLESRFDYFVDFKARDDEAKRTEQLRQMLGILKGNFNGFIPLPTAAPMATEAQIIAREEVVRERVLMPVISDVIERNTPEALRGAAETLGIGRETRQRVFSTLGNAIIETGDFFGGLWRKIG